MTTITNDSIPADPQAASVSKKLIWAGRIMSALPAVFLLFGRHHEIGEVGDRRGGDSAARVS